MKADKGGDRSWLLCSCFLSRYIIFSFSYSRSIMREARQRARERSRKREIKKKKKTTKKEIEMKKGKILRDRTRDLPTSRESESL